MSNVDSIRYQVLAARHRHDAASIANGGPTPLANKERDKALTFEMTRALVEERRQTGAATEAAMVRRYGFTAEDVQRLYSRALDAATERWVRRNMVEMSPC